MTGVTLGRSRSKRIAAVLIGSTFVFVLSALFSYRAGFKLPHYSKPPPVSLGNLDTTIYRKIWQTSKLPTVAQAANVQKNVKRWLDQNPTWRYELLTDQGSEAYVRQRFKNNIDIIETFMGVTDNILRADLIRYLVLLGDGGVYSDMDTFCLKPIHQWVPEEYKDVVNAVLGVEIDSFGEPRGAAMPEVQLVNWTLMSRAGHGLMERTVKSAIQALKELAQSQGQPLMSIKANYNEVLSSTGPVRLTLAAFEYLSEATGTEFTWKNVTGITTPLLVHDVLIMPVTSFGNGQVHSHSKPKTDPDALVNHQFTGSWKTGSHSFDTMLHGEKANENLDGVEKAKENGDGVGKAKENGDGVGKAKENGDGVGKAKENGDGVGKAKENGEGVGKAKENGDGVGKAKENGEGVGKAKENGDGVGKANTPVKEVENASR